MYYILLLIVLPILASVAYAASKGAPWVPTWKRDIERLIELADIQEGDIFFELGCGDGRICSTIARETKAEVIGIELSFAQYLAAKIRAFGKKNMMVRFGNVFHQDLSKADIVYMFLMPDVYKDIREKFEKELKPGTKIISYVWPIPDWEPKEISQEEGRSKLFLYVK